MNEIGVGSQFDPYRLDERSPAAARNQPERNPNLWTTCSRKSGYYDCAGGISGHVWVLSR